MPHFSCVTNAYLHRFHEILNEMVEDMTSVCPGDSISRTFILQMIPHHKAAISMSENILCYTTCLPIEAIAQNIISEQKKSIEQMQDCLDRCSGYENSEKELCAYEGNFQKITERMFREMRTAPAVNDVNPDFLREMLPHHEGAVRMCRNTLQFGICPELHPILEAIIRTQSRGILQMRALLRRFPMK